MRRGDFMAAWTISDEVLRRRIETDQACWDWPRHLQYVWRGGALRDKRVLVRCYHGLGDTIQFIRFAAPLRRLARHTVFWVQLELLELAKIAPGVDRAIPLHDGAPDVAYDLDIEIMELPHALRITPETLGCSVPYLFAGETGIASSRKRVGLVWRAGTWNPSRSIPIELLMRAREVAGFDLLSLQLDAEPAEIAALGATDWRSANVYQLATRVVALDLVITVDTMVAHLAGALGRPVWPCCRSTATGAGWRAATTPRGIRRCASFASDRPAGGRRCSTMSLLNSRAGHDAGMARVSRLTR